MTVSHGGHYSGWVGVENWDDLLIVPPEVTP
jgi:hypothetical protein